MPRVLALLLCMAACIYAHGSPAHVAEARDPEALTLTVISLADSTGNCNELSSCDVHGADQSGCTPVHGVEAVITFPSGDTHTVVTPATLALPAAGVYLIEALELPGWHVAAASHTGGAASFVARSKISITIDGTLQHSAVKLMRTCVPASVTAVAFFDANGNGQQDEHEAYMRGLPVCLTRADGAPATMDAAGSLFPGVDIQSCRPAGDHGRVTWLNVPPGAYLLSLPVDRITQTGLRPSGLPISFTIVRGQEMHAGMGVTAPCVGLPLDHWRNWRQSYSETTFHDVIATPLAHVAHSGRIAVADMMLAEAADSNPMAHLRALVFATTLTLRQSRRSTTASLYDGCLLHAQPELRTLGEAMATALAIVQQHTNADVSSSQLEAATALLSAFADQTTHRASANVVKSNVTASSDLQSKTFALAGMRGCPHDDADCDACMQA